jgi:hypothetical protein
MMKEDRRKNEEDVGYILSLEDWESGLSGWRLGLVLLRRLARKNALEGLKNLPRAVREGKGGSNGFLS